MPLFSVIVPCYNRRHLLEQALESIWAQAFTDFEIIVIDDGSEDDTWEYLCELGSRVRALRQSNLGPGTARNYGAQYARGLYLAFLDSDDLWFPWTLSTYARVIAQFQFPTLVAGMGWQLGQSYAENLDYSVKRFPCLLDACQGRLSR